MGKKRKKKIYTTPKKQKHIHKKANLNIIKVISNNQKCLKCNNYMANHFNRNTCSHCNYSEIKSL